MTDKLITEALRVLSGSDLMESFKLGEAEPNPDFKKEISNYNERFSTGEEVSSILVGNWAGGPMHPFNANQHHGVVQRAGRGGFAVKWENGEVTVHEQRSGMKRMGRSAPKTPNMNETHSSVLYATERGRYK